MDAPEITTNRGPAQLLETRCFPPPSLNGFSFFEVLNDPVCLLSGRSPWKAKIRHLEVGPLHNFLINVE